MPGKWGYIGGGAVLLVAGIVAARSDLPARLRGGRRNRWRRPPRLSPPRWQRPATAAPAPDDAALDRLNAELAAREAENTELRTTLAVRDTVLASLQADLAQRDDHHRRTGGAHRRQRRRDRHAPRGARHPAPGRAASRPRPPLFEPGPEDPSAARVEAVRAEAPAPRGGLRGRQAAAPFRFLARHRPHRRGPLRVRQRPAHPRRPRQRRRRRGDPGRHAARRRAGDRPHRHRRQPRRQPPPGGQARPLRRRRAGRRRPPRRPASRSTTPARPSAPVATDNGVPEPLNRTVAIIPVPIPTS